MKRDLSRREFIKLIGLLPLLGMLPKSTTVSGREATVNGAPSVLVLVFDALSGSNSSLYGYRRETTPNLKRFAQRATVYHRHIACGNFTSPGVSAILTGALPWSQRATYLNGTVLKEYQDKNVFSLLGSAGYYRLAFTHNWYVTTLLYQMRNSLDLFKRHDELFSLLPPAASSLFARDYNVAKQAEYNIQEKQLASDLPTSWILAAVNKARRSQTAVQLQRRYSDALPWEMAAQVTFDFPATMDWIAQTLRTAPRPFMAYLHVFPPHAPYIPPREFLDLFQDKWKPSGKPYHFFTDGIPDRVLNMRRREYDAYLRYTDSEFGRLLDRMERDGILDETVVIVTSDHGEQFERGNQTHGGPNLYQPLIHVPLLISLPGQREGRSVYTPTSAVDLLPTIARLTGQPIPAWAEGQVLPGLGIDVPADQRSVFAMDLLRNPKTGPLSIGTFTIFKDDYKLIHYFGYPGYSNEFELYDLRADPEELDDLFEIKSDVAGELRNELGSMMETVNRRFPQS